jgi:hypothetical protein
MPTAAYTFPRAGQQQNYRSSSRPDQRRNIQPLAALDCDLYDPSDGRKATSRCWLKRQILRGFCYLGMGATAKELAAWIGVSERTVKRGLRMLIAQGFISNVRGIYRLRDDGVRIRVGIVRRLHPDRLGQFPRRQNLAPTEAECGPLRNECGPTNTSPEGKNPKEGIPETGFGAPKPGATGSPAPTSPGEEQKQPLAPTTAAKATPKATPRKNRQLEAARQAGRIFTKRMPHDFASLCDVSAREGVISANAGILLTWFIYRAAHPVKEGSPQIARDVKYYVKCYDNFAAKVDSAKKLETYIGEYGDDRYQQFAGEFVRQANPELADWIEALMPD